MFKHYAILFMLFCAALHADEPSTLTVKGYANLYKPAEKFVMTIGVQSQDVSAEYALQQNNQKMIQIIDRVKNLGISPDEYKTGRFTIQPVYTQRPSPSPPNWSPEVAGYEVVNTVVIKSGQIKLIGEIIDGVTKAGANTIQGITFELTDSSLYRSEAIEAATANALKDARSLARAANVTLEKILNISLDDATVTPLAPRGQFLAKSMAMESTPIEPGDVEIRANVLISFEVK